MNVGTGLSLAVSWGRGMREKPGARHTDLNERLLQITLLKRRAWSF